MISRYLFLEQFSDNLEMFIDSPAFFLYKDCEGTKTKEKSERKNTNEKNVKKWE